MKAFLAWLALLGLISSVNAGEPFKKSPPASYFDNTGQPDVLNGGVRMIEINTSKGKFHVWTKMS